MTWDQYWHGDVWMTKVFLEADRIRQERMNAEKWLQGLYFHDAVCCALQNSFRKKNEKPAKYPENPYGFSKKDGSKKENVIDDGMTKEEREILIAKIMLDKERRASKQRWGGK